MSPAKSPISGSTPPRNLNDGSTIPPHRSAGSVAEVATAPFALPQAAMPINTKNSTAALHVAVCNFRRHSRLLFSPSACHAYLTRVVILCTPARPRRSSKLAKLIFLYNRAARFTSRPEARGSGVEAVFRFLGRELTFFRNSLQGEGR